MSYEFFPINEIIAQIQVDLGFSQDKYYSIIKRWIYEAMREIGTGRTEITSKVVAVDNLSVKKPLDYITLAHLFLPCDVDGNNYCIEPEYVMNTCCHLNRPKCDNRYKVSEADNSFYFSNSMKDIKKVELVYYSAPVDEDGNPKVPFFMREAVTAYCTHKLTQRKRLQNSASTASRMNPVSMSDIQYFKNEWERLKHSARASMKYPKTGAINQIGRRFLHFRSIDPLFRHYDRFLGID